MQQTIHETCCPKCGVSSDTLELASDAARPIPYFSIVMCEACLTPLVFDRANRLVPIDSADLSEEAQRTIRLMQYALLGWSITH